MPRIAILSGLVVAVLASRAQADEPGDLAAYVSAGTACAQARAHCFGIQLHVAKAAGEGYVVTPAWVAEQLAQAQALFAPLDVSFELVGADALPGSAAHLATRKDRDAVARGRLGGGVVHVVLTGKLDDVDVAGDVARGVTWRVNGDAQTKIIIVSGVAKPRTLAHELGHLFGLPHSTHAISIMNKRDRKTPPYEERRFADEEIVAMRPFLTSLGTTKLLVERPRPAQRAAP
ncbi:MAG: hypothetical protein NT062_23110 [Proteobacteria bacterium]|nr:hypothetical protein [Pseudomonadota bacterium]